MTKKLVEQYGITIEGLNSMEPGDQIGPFKQGYLVQPSKRKGAHNSGYPEAMLVIKRFDYEKFLWGIVNIISRGSSTGPNIQGMTAEAIMKELESDAHCVPGEIKNLGE